MPLAGLGPGAPFQSRLSRRNTCLKAVPKGGEAGPTLAFRAWSRGFQPRDAERPRSCVARRSARDVFMPASAWESQKIKGLFYLKLQLG